MLRTVLTAAGKATTSTPALKVLVEFGEDKDAFKAHLDALIAFTFWHAGADAKASLCYGALALEVVDSAEADATAANSGEYIGTELT